jgi:hypothetical protein
MRRVRIVVITAAIAVALAGMWLAFAWHHPPTLPPSARIYLVGYTNFTMSNLDTNVLVYPGRGSWLRAQMILTNEGRASISYGAWGDEPYGWAKVETVQGTTNGYLAPPFTGGTALLRPGCAAKFWVILPTTAVQWECGFDTETASVRERAIWRMLESKFYRRIPEVFFYPVRLLPGKTGPSVEVKSGRLDITNAAVSPHNKGAAANRRSALQSDSSGNVSAIVAADRAFPAAVAELDR